MLRPLLGLTLLFLGTTTSALAAPTITIDSPSFGNVFVRGETPVLQITITGDDGGFRGRLRAGALDAYGRRAGRLSRPIVLAPGATVTTFFALRTRRLGHFTVTASLKGRGAAAAVTATAAIVPPVDETPVEGSAVGYFVYPVPGELANAAGIAASMRRLGVRWVRFGFQGWYDTRRDALDRTDPEWLDTAAYERWVDAFRAQGIGVVGTIFGLPRWASSRPDDETPVGGLPTWSLVAPRDVDEEWPAIVRTLAQRLAGRIRDWEVWNEPNHHLYWQSSAAEFATLVQVTARAVREVDPTARIIVNFAPSLVGPFESEVLTNAAHEIDIFGWHYADAEDVAAARAFLPSMRPGAVIWDTEASGAPRRHVNMWLAERAAGVERIFPFIFHLPDPEEFTGLDRFGRYPVHLDYTPRLDGLALRTLSDAVGSAPTLVATDAGLGWQAFTAPDGVVALADMNQPGDTWSGMPGVFVTLEIPTGVKRLLATDLMGNTRAVRVRGGRARLRVLGMAEFLRAEPAAALTSVRVADIARAR